MLHRHVSGLHLCLQNEITQELEAVHPRDLFLQLVDTLCPLVAASISLMIESGQRSDDHDPVLWVPVGVHRLGWLRI